ncbi:uncharacterized protein CC84DRAFT_1187448 [Paraphaeosphaeria sporulosa]|uniref:Uncharacterized protein n=1 Tax=Paraphaeosphaeria sporulosa TaxID=1460663 RepID=A0A177CC09_9PLEO|nr:uncharacterized protein CC84DRAFT_1187448 [Paraphaeosphaeria sporulosa]OAG04339.1 hypothetical protein CC84DRAFT_1187448 [Paraphaeosphaeria sporulosa]
MATDPISLWTLSTTGLAFITKGDFFPLFWNASKASFKESTILSSFKVSGISPPDPQPVLDRFTRSQESRESSLSSLSDHNWRKVDRLIRFKLRQSLHHLSVQNELLHHDIDGLRQALATKKKPLKLSQKGKRKASKLSLQIRKRQKRVADAQDVGEASEGASAAPARSTRRGRNVKLQIDLSKAN